MSDLGNGGHFVGSYLETDAAGELREVECQPQAKQALSIIGADEQIKRAATKLSGKPSGDPDDDDLEPDPLPLAASNRVWVLTTERADEPKTIKLIDRMNVTLMGLAKSYREQGYRVTLKSPSAPVWAGMFAQARGVAV